MNAVHQSEYDVVRGPLHPRSRESSTADVEVILPTRSAVGLAVTRRGIDGEIGIAAVTGIVPFGKFDVDFILSINADVMSRPVGKETEHRRGIHVINIALDHPLVGSEAESFGGKHFRRGPFSVTLSDFKMQVSFVVDADVLRISAGNAGHSSAGHLPCAASPCDCLCLREVTKAEQDEADDGSSQHYFEGVSHFSESLLAE